MDKRNRKMFNKGVATSIDDRSDAYAFVLGLNSGSAGRLFEALLARRSARPKEESTFSARECNSSAGFYEDMYRELGGKEHVAPRAAQTEDPDPVRRTSQGTYTQGD